MKQRPKVKQSDVLPHLGGTPGDCPSALSGCHGAAGHRPLGHRPQTRAREGCGLPGSHQSGCSEQADTAGGTAGGPAGWPPARPLRRLHPCRRRPRGAPPVRAPPGTTCSPLSWGTAPAPPAPPPPPPRPSPSCLLYCLVLPSTCLESPNTQPAIGADRWTESATAG